jgi:hypothetical protein
MNDWQEMYNEFTGPLSHPQELQRLKTLLEGANNQLAKVGSDKEQSQLDGVQSRVDFIDKLTIGAGATIGGSLC